MNKKMKQLSRQQMDILTEAKLYAGNREVVKDLVIKAGLLNDEYLAERERYNALPIWKQLITSGR